jgi:hypothetical protein
LWELLSSVDITHLFSCLLLMITERMINARGSPLSIEIPPAEGS